MDEYAQPEKLLKFASNTINAMLDGLSLIEEEDRDNIMKLCGEACSKEKIWGPSIELAEKISREAKEIDEIIERLNSEISWCGEWIRNGNTISSTCNECGCPLVRHNIVKNSEIFCNCSNGWVETIFSALFAKPVRTHLEKALGRGDSECRFVVFFEEGL